MSFLFLQQRPQIHQNMPVQAMACVKSTPLVSNQATIRSNLVESVVALCDQVEELKADSVMLADVTATRECLTDLHLALCELMHSMIASPLTGRIFLSSPEAYVTDVARQESFQTQFASRL